MIESNGSCSSNNNEVEAWADKYALFLHYKKKHSNLLSRNMMLSEAYEVIFIEKPNFNNLDTRENFWIRRTNAAINLSRTFLPKYM